MLLLAASTVTEALNLHHIKTDNSGGQGSRGEYLIGQFHITSANRMQGHLRDRGILPPRQVNTSDPLLDQWVSLPLDHSGEDERMFDNRYWISTSDYEGAGHPIFIYDNGEGAGYGGILEDTWFQAMVQKFGGIGISWEHRYYGESVPVRIDNETDPEDMKFLTVEQALADVAAFASNFSHPDYADIDLTPTSTPWIFVGGSYPGIRAALMRQLYPDIIFASYASSAPVEARVNMSSYYDPIWEGMISYGYGGCVRDVQAAIHHIDDLLETKEGAAKVKKLFLGRNAEKNTNGDFARALSIIWNSWQNYGATSYIDTFCTYLETRNTTNGTTLYADADEGWAPTMGAAWVVKHWAEWPYFAPLASYDCEGNANIITAAPSANSSSSDDENDDDDGPACQLTQVTDDPDSISWTWQYCTQWGYLMPANVGPRQIVSKFDTLDFEMSVCRAQFPNAGDLIPEWPDVESLNALTDGWNMRPSNTFWTGGEFDPWRTLSPLADEGEDAPMPYLTQDAPECGVSTTVDEIFGYILPNAQHCYDLDDNLPAYKAQKYFTDALTKWLKCFDGGQQY